MIFLSWISNDISWHRLIAINNNNYYKKFVVGNIIECNTWSARVVCVVKGESRLSELFYEIPGIFRFISDFIKVTLE